MLTCGNTLVTCSGIIVFDPRRIKKTLNNYGITFCLKNTRFYHSKSQWVVRQRSKWTSCIAISSTILAVFTRRDSETSQKDTSNNNKPLELVFGCPCCFFLLSRWGHSTAFTIVSNRTKGDNNTRPSFNYVIKGFIFCCS